MGRLRNILLVILSLVGFDPRLGFIWKTSKCPQTNPALAVTLSAPVLLFRWVFLVEFWPDEISSHFGGFNTEVFMGDKTAGAAHDCLSSRRDQHYTFCRWNCSSYSLGKFCPFRAEFLHFSEFHSHWERARRSNSGALQKPASACDKIAQSNYWETKFYRSLTKKIANFFRLPHTFCILDHYLLILSGDISTIFHAQ